MILTRAFSFGLRFAEFVCAAVVMGIVGHFLHIRHKTGQGPRGRTIYTEIVSAVALVLSLVWLLPFTSSFMHYPMDLLLSFAWFAAFGAILNWYHKLGCDNSFNWDGITRGGVCNQWKAAEAFCFLSAVFWLASAILSVYVFHKRKTEHTNGATVATDGTAKRRRWGRKSQV